MLIVRLFLYDITVIFEASRLQYGIKQSISYPYVSQLLPSQILPKLYDSGIWDCN